MLMFIASVIEHIPIPIFYCEAAMLEGQCDCKPKRWHLLVFTGIEKKFITPDKLLRINAQENKKDWKNKSSRCIAYLNR